MLVSKLVNTQHHAWYEYTSLTLPVPFIYPEPLTAHAKMDAVETLDTRHLDECSGSALPCCCKLTLWVNAVNAVSLMTRPCELDLVEAAAVFLI